MKIPQRTPLHQMEIRYTICLLILGGLLLSGNFVQAQITRSYSYGSAFATLNATTVAPAPVTYTNYTSAGSRNSAAGAALPKDYNKKWIINYGIPIQVSLDYAYLRARMITAYEEDPGPYDRGSAAMKEAVDILGWADFVTISSWAPVRCQLFFRYLLPQMGIQESTKFKYSNEFNPLSGPVKGSTTFWIRK
jgi:hypothetical protein